MCQKGWPNLCYRSPQARAKPKLSETGAEIGLTGLQHGGAFAGLVVQDREAELVHVEVDVQRQVGHEDGGRVQSRDARHDSPTPECVERVGRRLQCRAATRAPSVVPPVTNELSTLMLERLGSAMVTEFGQALYDAYQGEARGQAFFETLADSAPHAAARDKWRALARLEAATQDRLRPCVVAMGLDATPDPKRIDEGEAAAHRYEGQDWETQMRSMQPILKRAARRSRSASARLARSIARSAPP